MNRSAVVRRQKTDEIPEWARPDLSMVDTKADASAVLIERDRIEPNTLNSRTHFAPESLKELGDSIKAHGLLQAIIVRHHPAKEGKFQIVSGERRWRAAGEKFGDVPTLRCVIRDVSDAELMLLNLIENVQREDLSAAEKAHGLISYKNVNSNLHWNDIAALVGKTRQWVHDTVSVLKAPEPVQEAIASGDLTAGHYKLIRSLPEPQQIKLARQAVRQELSTRELRSAVAEVKGREIPPRPPSERSTPAPATAPAMPPFKRGQAMLDLLFQNKLNADRLIALSDEGEPSTEQLEEIWRAVEDIETRLERFKGTLPGLGKLRLTA